MGIVADVLEVCADDAEALFLAVFLEVMNPLYGVFLIQIAAQAIDGIGGIGNNPALLESVDNLTDKPQLRIFGIYLDDHVPLPPVR
jgi:hypothetical protein